MTASVGPAVGRGDGDQAATGKGLKAGALGLLSSVVIGVASTAPAYSLAATLGFVVLAVGLHERRRSCCWRSCRCCSSPSPTRS
jgi:hypothetical protein